MFRIAFDKKFDLKTDAEVKSVRNFKQEVGGDGMTMISFITKSARSHKNYNMKLINKIIKHDFDRGKIINENNIIQLGKDYEPIEDCSDLFAKLSTNYIYIVIVPQFFIDIGRDWIKTTNLVKWDKGKNEIKTYSIKK